MLPATFTVTTSNDAAPTPPAGSFREAINLANRMPDLDIITFATGVTLLTPVANNPYPAITTPVTIQGINQGGVRVEVSGTTGTTLPAGNGLVFAPGSNGSLVTGLTINRFGGAGIELQAGDITLTNNRIGTDPTGTLPRGNGTHGILVSSSNNRIGMLGGVGGNTIAFNGSLLAPNSAGIFVASGVNNLIASNSIFSNAPLGIDLGPEGPHRNDPGDTDTGPNNLQNSPVLTQVASPPTSSLTTTRILGSLSSTPNTLFTIQFFENQASDPLGSGEGEIFITDPLQPAAGQIVVTTDSSGFAPIDATLPVRTTVGDFITATATDPNNNTSEFSAARVINPSFLSFVDLGVTLTATPALPRPFPAGSDLTYTATVTNTGNNNAANVTLTEQLPAGVILENVVAPAGVTFTQAGNILTFNLGTVAVNQTVTVTITVSPAVAGVITNTVTVDAPNVLDFNRGNNTATLDTQIVIPPDRGILSFMTIDNSPLVNVGEGGRALVTVRRTNNLTGTVTVSIETTNTGTATAGTDFVATSGILTFNENQQTQTFEVQTLEDGEIEGTETIGLILRDASGNAIIGVPNQTQVRIFDNDPTTLQFIQPTFAERENGTIVRITVRRSGSTVGAATVNFATSNGTAVADRDYVPTSGTLRFEDGDPTEEIEVRLINNSLIDGNRTFNVTLSGATGAALSSPSQAVVTIVDDETPGAGFFRFSNPTYTVGEGAGQVMITVTRVGGTGAASITFDATGGGTATPGDDFVSTTGTLVFADGQTSQNFTVPIRNDGLAEGDETVLLRLGASGTAGLLDPSTATLTIVDDDAIPPAGVLQFDPPVFTVIEGGGVLATITVTRTGGSAGAVSVPVRLALPPGGGTATPDLDYAPFDTVLDFAAGQMSRSLTFAIVDDTLVEGPETVNLVLGSPTGGAILGNQTRATLAIVDNDVERIPPTVVDVQFVGARRGIGGVVLTFSEPLDPRTVNQNTFRVLAVGRDGIIGTRDDRARALRSVQYVPGTLTVTVTLARRIARGQFLQVFVNGSAPAGVTDLAGNLLDGEGDRRPGGNFSQTIGQASTLRYRDADGDIVTLRLRGGGVLELVRSAPGEGLTLRVLGARPGRSVLSGGVRRARRGDGTTTLQAIAGLGSFGEVRSTLRTPPFLVNELPTVSIQALDAVLTSNAGSLGRRGRRS